MARTCPGCGPIDLGVLLFPSQNRGLPLAPRSREIKAMSLTGDVLEGVDRGPPHHGVIAVKTLDQVANVRCISLSIRLRNRGNIGARGIRCEPAIRVRRGAGSHKERDGADSNRVPTMAVSHRRIVPKPGKARRKAVGLRPRLMERSGEQ